MNMRRKFTWNSWDFDFDGDAYIIAKSECPERESVPDYIICVDNLNDDRRAGMVVQEGWCKFQVRSDWENHEGPHGWYVVEQYEPLTLNLYGKRNPGWFPVWIVRKDEWY
jgi:hypothetical protein